MSAQHPIPWQLDRGYWADDYDRWDILDANGFSIGDDVGFDKETAQEIIDAVNGDQEDVQSI